MAAILSPDRHLRSLPAVATRGSVRAASSRPWEELVGSRPAVAVAGLVLALLLVVGGALVIGRGGLASLAPAPPAATATATVTAGAAGTQTVVVEPGDTLWSIARRLQPSGDVRPLVDRLVAAHGTGALQAGEVLAVAA